MLLCYKLFPHLPMCNCTVIMLTRCPYPNCLAEFETECDLPAGDWHFERGHCASCGRPASLRPMSVIETVDRILKQRQESGTICSVNESNNAPYSVACILEDVRSLWNVGSIFRTSDGAGVEKIFLCGVTGCPPRKEIAKTSLGAENTIPWEYASGTVAVLSSLRERGFQILGLERNSVSRLLSAVIAEGLLKKPICMVVGNEVTGLSAETLALCHFLGHLPMRGHKESLNVAVAYGIAIYSVTERLSAII